MKANDYDGEELKERAEIDSRICSLVYEML